MNKVTHFEIVAVDTQRAMQFYTNVFDWEFEKWGDSGSDMEYWVVKTVPAGTPGAINGGLRKEMGTDVKERTTSVNGFVCSIEVADIDDILAKVAANGGEIMMEKTPVEGLGDLAACLDSEGNMFNLLQQESKPE